MLKSYLFVLFLVLYCYSAYAQHIVLNKGIAGNNTIDLLKRIDKDVISEVPDLVIIMVGTNDMVNSNKIIPYSQFRNNYQQIINKLKTRNIKVVLMSPPLVDTGYIFQRHQRSRFSEDPNAKIDSISHIIKELSNRNHLYFIDLNSSFKSAGSPNRTAGSLIINKANFNIEDGIHPTKQGYEFIAKTVFNYLKKKRLLKKNRRIVCFGDSITYGSFMQGAGTSEGDTYPARLRNLIQISSGAKK